MDEPAEVAHLRAQVNLALAAYLDTSLPRLSDLHPHLAPAADELAAFVLGGGKRLRPVFVLLGARAAGGDTAAAMGPALALEMLHTCALLHDDVIDDASTRRGRPASHHAFARLHERSGWTGDPATFGTAAAILAGDLAFVLADELFLSALVEPDRLLAAQRAYITLREEVMAGQYLDVVASGSAGADRDLALTVASLKSGRYTIARPLQIGALLAGADRALLDGLLAFGDPLGTAFQLRDDVLGVFGTEGETGKSADSDLREGKATLLVAETYTRLEPADREVFTRSFGRHDLDFEGAERLRALVRGCGALDATLATAQRLHDESLSALSSLAIDDGTRSLLADLAAYVVQRRR